MLNTDNMEAFFLSFFLLLSKTFENKLFLQPFYDSLEWSKIGVLNYILEPFLISHITGQEKGGGEQKQCSYLGILKVFHDFLNDAN